MDGLRYRPEIDGLRGIAILVVVLFHARVPGFAGGFVGVDVFFVISGFLISRLLLDELTARGRIDLVDFYARRVRRLLPALLFVVAVVLVVGTLTLSAAGERQDLSASAVATVGFVANIYFWREQAGYFTSATEWQPLLNMWTLAVEEQFYALWPGLLLAAALVARWSRRRLETTVALLLGLLFAASVATAFWIAPGKPTAAFYLLPTRLWELALGGGLALAQAWLPRKRPLAGPIGLVGLAAIGLVVVASGPRLSFAVGIPGAAAAATVVLASIVAGEGSSAARLLSVAPLVRIGRVSYAWYLWHWPLLSLARLGDFGHDSRARDIAMVTLALVLAELTYRFLEDPIRRGRPWPFSGARQTLTAGVALSLSVVAVAVALKLQADAAMRRDPRLASIHEARASFATLPPRCPADQRFEALRPARDCTIGAAGHSPRLLLWGDSHAEHLAEVIGADAAADGNAVLLRIKDGCPPVFDRRGGGDNVYRCAAFNAAVTAEIPRLAQQGLRGIVLASRTFGVGAPGEMAAWRRGIEDILSTARRHGLRVLMMAPVPTWRFDVPRCLAHRSAVDCGLDRGTVDARRAPILAALQAAVGSSDNARLWDPIDRFCDARHCSPVQGGAILYADWSHLTKTGARFLGPTLAPELDWLMQPAGSAAR